MLFASRQENTTLSPTSQRAAGRAATAVVAARAPWAGACAHWPRQAVVRIDKPRLSHTKQTDMMQMADSGLLHSHCKAAGDVVDEVSGICLAANLHRVLAGDGDSGSSLRVVACFTHDQGGATIAICQLDFAGQSAI